MGLQSWTFKISFPVFERGIWLWEWAGCCAWVGVGRFVASYAEMYTVWGGVWHDVYSHDGRRHDIR